MVSPDYPNSACAAIKVSPDHAALLGHGGRIGPAECYYKCGTTFSARRASVEP